MRPITDVLRDIRGGSFVDVASDKLAELVKAVDFTKKTGSITITLKLKPDSEAGAFEMSADISAKIPAPDTAKKAIFFGTPDGDLLRTDPKQREMPFDKPKETKAA